MDDLVRSVPRRALVTGASGFIGAALAEALAAAGTDVHLFVRAGTARPLPRGLEDEPEVTVHVLPSDTVALVALVGSIAPDAAFHVASCFLARHEPADVERLVASNVLFGTQLAEACAAVGPVRFVDVGTSWQHAAETGDYQPVNLYAATKQAFQDVLAWYDDATKLRAITVKLFDTYGPGDERGKLLAALAASARSGSTMRMSPGEQELDLLHVDDVVSGLLQAWRLLDDGDVTTYASFGLSSGARLTLRELVDIFAEATGRRPSVEFGALDYRPREVMRTWRPDVGLPGWVPARDLRSGLAATFTKD